MASPVILINSATGSDSLASGAGPATALNGTAAATDGVNGKTVTITDTVDLSGVATDGSAALYLVDATAAHRNFDNITAISGGPSGSAWTVTVQNGFTISLSGKSWAIGGKRASIGSSTSSKLIENNSGNGDAMPGWAIEMQSGHTETIAATVNPRRAGDTTNGRIILRGTSGAATRPILTFSNNGDAFVPRGNYWTFRDFEMQNSNATKTASQAFDSTAVTAVIYQSIKISDSTNKFWRAFNTVAGPTDITIQDCYFANLADSAVVINNSLGGIARIRNCVFLSCASHGILHSTTAALYDIRGNIFAFNGGDGVHINDTASSITVFCEGNVFHGNTSDGFESAQTAAHSQAPWIFDNNRFTFNGGVGLNFSGATFADVIASGLGFQIRNNGFYTNTGGSYAGITSASSQNEITSDPSAGLASATKDYAGATTGTNFMSSVGKGLGYPIGGTLAVGAASSSYNYKDTGLQHQDSGGGGTTVIVLEDD